MGGYDRLLFKIDEKIPNITVTKFWKLIKEKMWKGYSSDKNDRREFESIWNNENSSFEIFLYEGDDPGLYGKLDW